MSAFEARYREIEKNLFLVAVGYLKNTEDARDALQEAAITGFLSYPSLKDQARFKSWMTKIVIRKCLDLLRRERTRRRYAQQVVDTARLFDAVPAQEIELLDLVCRLPEQLRPYITLRFYQDLTYEEVAGLLHVPVSTARSRTQKALATLEQWMEASP